VLGRFAKPRVASEPFGSGPMPSAITPHSPPALPRRRPRLPGA